MLANLSMRYVSLFLFQSLDTSLYVELVTKQHISKLEDEGDITPAEVKTFFLSVHGFYVTATEFAFDNLPMIG